MHGNDPYAIPRNHLQSIFIMGENSVTVGPVPVHPEIDLRGGSTALYRRCV